MNPPQSAPKRREPPPLRRCEVLGVAARSTSMLRVTLVGAELVGLQRGDPGSSVRLLLPRDDAMAELPTWQGNEFLYRDGTRPRLRTLTPLEIRTGGGVAELDVDIVLHDDSPLSRWARTAAPGSPVAVSGTGTGYPIDAAVSSYVLLGDESAVPAVVTLLAALPPASAVGVRLERRPESPAVTLPEHPGADVRWTVQGPGCAPGATLVEAAAEAELTDQTRVWAAGEAAAMQQIRRVLSDQRGLPRSRTVVRGYWKAGRAGT